MPYRTRPAVPGFFLAVALAFLFLCPSVNAAAKTVPGPAESIRMLQKGIDDKDLDLVEKYVDIDAMVGKAVDQLLADEEILQEAGKNPAIAMIFALGGNAGANDALRSLLSAEARGYVNHGVTSGAFAGEPEKNASTYQSLFGKVFRGGEKDRKRFGPASVKSRNKNTAVVATTLVDGVKQRVYPLELQLENQNGVWRVVGLNNKPGLARKDKGGK
jgi:hypothetical protein